MYFKHTNPIALRSQEMISDSLISLMKRMPFSKITVTQICEEAGIGRKTFYRHFELKEDIIAYQVEQLYDEYTNEVSTISAERLLRFYLEFHKKHMEYLILLNQNGLSSQVFDRFSSLLAQMMPVWSNNAVVQQYRSNYVIAGLQAILYTWVIRDFSESVDELITIIHHTFE